MIDAIQLVAGVGALGLLVVTDSQFAHGVALALTFVFIVVDAWRR